MQKCIVELWSCTFVHFPLLAIWKSLRCIFLRFAQQPSFTIISRATFSQWRPFTASFFFLHCQYSHKLPKGGKYPLPQASRKYRLLSGSVRNVGSWRGNGLWPTVRPAQRCNTSRSARISSRNTGPHPSGSRQDDTSSPLPRALCCALPRQSRLCKAVIQSKAPSGSHSPLCALPVCLHSI